MHCKRRKAAPAKNIIAPLPELQIRIWLQAFSHVSAGPLLPNKEEERPIRRDIVDYLLALRHELFISMYHVALILAYF